MFAKHLCETSSSFEFFFPFLVCSESPGSGGEKRGWERQRSVFFFVFVLVFVIKALGKQRCCRLSNSLPACLAGWLTGWLPLQEPQYFTAVVSAIDSAVNLAPHPWKRFRILIPLTPPPKPTYPHLPWSPPLPLPPLAHHHHPQFIPTSVRSANKILCMIFFLALPLSSSRPSPLHFLACSPPPPVPPTPTKRIQSTAMASALVGSGRMCSAQ